MASHQLRDSFILREEFGNVSELPSYFTFILILSSIIHIGIVNYVREIHIKYLNLTFA